MATSFPASRPTRRSPSFPNSRVCDSHAARCMLYQWLTRSNSGFLMQHLLRFIAKVPLSPPESYERKIFSHIVIFVAIGRAGTAKIAEF